MNKLFKILVVSGLSLTSMFGMNYGELYGDWEISSMDRNTRIYFNGDYSKNVNVNFTKEGTVNSIESQPKYFSLQNNKLIMGKYRNNDRVYGSLEEWQIIGNVDESKSYGMICYEIKNVKMSSGIRNKKDRIKMCREPRRHHREW